MDNPIRVLHVVVNMNRGGAETLLMNLYRNINRKNVQFDFLTFKPGVFDEEILSMGGRVHRIPYITDKGHLGFTNALSHFFASHKEYKIVHSHMDKMSGFILKYAKQAEIPIRIAHSHNTESEGKVFSKLYKWYAGSHILKSATHFYACSNKAAQWLFGPKSQQGIILKNGIESDKFAFSPTIRKEVKNELGLKEDGLVLGHVGRFFQQKNHLFLLDVFSNLVKIIPNAELVLVGDGQLKQKIQNRIRELDIEKNVKLLGIRSDIHRLLQAFDVFVMPSLHEGLPVTLIEAQTSGLPCLISNTISKEVDLGINLVDYLPLTNKHDWIQAIIHCDLNRKHRDIPTSILLSRGYDIKKTAENTTLSYLALGEKAI